MHIDDQESSPYLDPLKRMPMAGENEFDGRWSSNGAGPKLLDPLMATHRDEFDELMAGDNAYGLEGLKREIREAYGYPDDIVITIGNGTTLLFLAIAASADRKATRWIERGGYVAAGDMAKALGYTVRDLKRSAGDRYQPRLPRAAAGRPAVLYVSDPHNPTGKTLTPASLRMLYGCGAVVIRDRSLARPPGGPARPATRMPHNAVDVVSFSKGFGLPHLRLGFAAARPPLGEAIQRLWVHTVNQNCKELEARAAIAVRYREAFARSFDDVTGENKRTLRELVDASRGSIQWDDEGVEGTTALLETSGDPMDVERALRKHARAHTLAASRFGINRGVRISLCGNAAAFREALTRVIETLSRRKT